MEKDQKGMGKIEAAICSLRQESNSFYLSSENMEQCCYFAYLEPGFQYRWTLPQKFLRQISTTDLAVKNT